MIEAEKKDDELFCRKNRLKIKSTAKPDIQLTQEEWFCKFIRPHRYYFKQEEKCKK